VRRHVCPRTDVSVSEHYKDPIKRAGLVQSEHHHNHFMFSPWYGW